MKLLPFPTMFYVMEGIKDILLFRKGISKGVVIWICFPLLPIVVLAIYVVAVFYD